MKNTKELRKLNNYLDTLDKSMFEMNTEELKDLNKKLKDSLKVIKSLKSPC
tara:strand:+ start:466 stop:618 length:153 start_codon:yes stop_codon:yes gene_type:complete